MKKRGRRGVFGKKANIMNEIYFVMFELILVTIVTVALVQYVRGAANDLNFEKKFLARDISYLASIASGAPEMLDYTYYGNISQYDLELLFAAPRLTIVEPGKPLQTIYRYGSDLNLGKLSKKVLSSEPLTFHKTKADFKVNDFVAQLQVKPLEVDTKVDNWETTIKIFIDPAFGDGRGDIFEDKKEWEIADNLAKTLAAILSNAVLTKEGSANPTMDERIDAVEDGQADMVISIRIPSHGFESPDNPFIVHIAGDADPDIKRKSLKLAGLLIKQFSDNQKEINSLLSEFTEFRVTPIDTSQLRSKDPNKILFDDRVSVVIKIGDLDKGVVNINAAAKAIHEAVKQYYGIGKAAEGDVCLPEKCKELSLGWGVKPQLPAGSKGCHLYGGVDEKLKCEKDTQICCKEEKSDCEQENGLCVENTAENKKDCLAVSTGKCPGNLVCCKK